MGKCFDFIDGKTVEKVIREKDGDITLHFTDGTSSRVWCDCGACAWDAKYNPQGEYVNMGPPK